MEHVHDSFSGLCRARVLAAAVAVQFRVVERGVRAENEDKVAPPPTTSGALPYPPPPPVRSNLQVLCSFVVLCVFFLLVLRLSVGLMPT